MKICTTYPSVQDDKVIGMIEKTSLEDVINAVKQRHENYKKINPGWEQEKADFWNRSVKDMLDDYMIVNWAWIEDDAGNKIPWSNELFKEFE